MKNPQRLCAVFAAIFVLSLGLASCPDPTKDTTTTYQPPPPSLKEVTVTPNKNVTAGMPLSATSQSDASYQWYKDGEPIPDASGRTYTPTSGGSYSVAVNKEGYTGATSNVVIVKDAVSNSFDILVDDLMVLSGDSAEAPVPVKLERTFISTENPAPANSTGWADIYDILSDAKKYVVLDLSECSFPNVSIINSIGDSAYIKGIILPEGTNFSGLNGCTGLTSITLPKDITEFPPFVGCTSLASITFTGNITNDGTAAGENYASLTTINITETVISISNGFFTRFPALETIAVAAANTVYASEDGVLFTKDKSSLVAYPRMKGGSSYTIPQGVTAIGSYAFYDCTDLTSITIPQGVTSIGNYAFLRCSGLTSITIPQGVTSIRSYAFNDCTGLTNITIPQSVTSIGYSTFQGCTSLTSVIIPGSVTTISYRAFEYCTGLTNVTISEGVTSIESEAFYGCNGLTSITIPGSVTNIWFNNQTNHYDHYDAFGCYNLASITVDPANTVYTSEDGVLLTKDKTSILLFPRRKSGAYTIPGSVTSIEDYAFSDYTGLTDIIIPDSVTSIGNRAFSRCSGLTSITIPGSVTSIGYDAFEGCTGLKNLTFEGSGSGLTIDLLDNIPGLENITVESANTAYSSENGVLFNKNKSSLLYYPRGKSDVSFTIPGSVTTINYSAFQSCTGLTDVIIPASVTNIGWDAFSGCTALVNVNFGGTNTSIGASAFPYSASGGSDTLRNLYASASGGAGIYTRTVGADDWVKQ